MESHKSPEKQQEQSEPENREFSYTISGVDSSFLQSSLETAITSPKNKNECLLTQKGRMQIES